MYDLVIKGGTVIDGTGAAAAVQDVAIIDGRIVEVGPGLTHAAREVIDAEGHAVTPGFIDIHTHYDGQVTWDDQILPSGAHGVTTVLLGACGIGFAPVRPGSEEWLIAITEGVEDIPGSALHIGIDWRWESFTDYLDVLAGRSYSVDVAAHVPHSAIRAYVMERRAEADEPATADDLAAMCKLVAEGIEAGAVGVGTSRVATHRGSDGSNLPGTRAAEQELLALASAMCDAGGGVLQLVPSGAAGGVEGQAGGALRAGLTRRDHHTLLQELELMRRIHRETGQPVTFTFGENRGLGKETFQQARQVLAEIAGSGERIFPQVAPRPIGGLISLGTYHPFTRRPTYLSLAHLPVAERAQRMAAPGVRAAILAEADVEVVSDDPRDHTHATLQRHVGDIYNLAQLDYEPDPSSSAAAVAASSGREPLEVLYDWLLDDEGTAVAVWLATSYLDGDLSTVRELLMDPQSVVGLGDGGAHVKFICDASFPTFLLSHWGRDRQRGPTLPVEHLVHKLTKAQADLYGLSDRGVIAPGMRADLNVIDLASVGLRRPRLVDDLPGGAERYMQDADGYLCTLVRGVVTRRVGRDTGERPGRLVRRNEIRDAANQ